LKVLRLVPLLFTILDFELAMILEDFDTTLFERIVYTFNSILLMRLEKERAFTGVKNVSEEERKKERLL
jgi:hypothetical protein